ncbi:hypothetical protein [Caballeronia insecticola]|nr:hypothetical protein [Caballeronia insecticola]
MAEINFTGSIPLVPANANTRELMDFSGRAYSLYNVLSFMTEAMDEDEPGGQPIKCTLVDLRGSAEKLAEDLQQASDRSRINKSGSASNDTTLPKQTFPVDLREVARMADTAQGSIQCLCALATEAISMPGCEAERQLAVLATNMLPIIGAQMDRILANLGEMRTGSFDEHIESMGLRVAPYAEKLEPSHE